MAKIQQRFEIISGKFTHKVDINSSNNESGAIRFIYNGK
jgi:hypothetical protein